MLESATAPIRLNALNARSVFALKKEVEARISPRVNCSFVKGSYSFPRGDGRCSQGRAAESALGYQEVATCSIPFRDGIATEQQFEAVQLPESMQQNQGSELLTEIKQTRCVLAASCYTMLSTERCPKMWTYQ